MKTLVNILLMIGLFHNLLFAQINWELDYESANFAFLVEDYDTYNFEGGYFTKFDYYPGFDSIGIPFNVIYNPPADTGDISFAYSATDDTVFFASIWWMGQGHIVYPDPDSIEDSSSFTYDSILTINSCIIEYFNYYIDEIADTVFRRKADSAWLSIKKLSILKSFNEEGSIFRVGVFLYTPSVGPFNSEVAKWIIFLYRGQLLVGVEDERELPNYNLLYQNYPNPFNPITNIEFDIAESQNVELLIYDILGTEKEVLFDGYMKAGRHKIVFNGLNYASGVYLYKIVTDNYTQTKKLLLLK